MEETYHHRFRELLMDEEMRKKKMKMKMDYRRPWETSRVEVIEFPLASSIVHLVASKGLRNKRRTPDLIDHKVEKTKPYSVSVRGETSESASFTCKICLEPRPWTESFSTDDCNHCYCSECMERYVMLKIQENVIHIVCPEPKCKGVLDPKRYSSILPWQVFVRWSTALFESLIPDWYDRLYCPYKDCSALLGRDDGEKFKKDSECPRCGRPFCAQCKVPWHYRLNCREFQRMMLIEEEDNSEEEDNIEEEDAMLLMNLSKGKKFQRCTYSDWNWRKKTNSAKQ